MEALRTTQEAMRLSIEFPFLPQMDLAINRILFGAGKMTIRQLYGMHAAKVRKVKEEYAEYIATIQHTAPVQDWLNRSLAPIRVTWVARYTDHRRRDPGGILEALKAAQDAVVKMKLLQDDGPPIVQEVTIKVLLGQHREGTELILEEVR